MTPDLVARVLADYEALRDPAGDAELEAVKAAIFVEDVFGFTLSDAEIDPARLGTAEALHALVVRRAGTA
jgi:hypothetical protein